MEQITAPPSGVWDALWPTVQPALTPELVGAMAVTLAATHSIKIIAEYRLPQVTDTAEHWRAFCASTSVAVGSLAGLITWMASDAPWAIVPMVALGSGPLWRLLQALLPKRISNAFLTATDRRYRRKEEA